MQTENPCYKALLLFTTFARSILKNTRDFSFVINRIINKCCIKHDDKYVFKDNLSILHGGVMNENIQKGKLYSHDEMCHVISTKIITDQSNPDLKYSLFRNKLNDVKRMIATWHDDMIKEELLSHFPIISSINCTDKEDAFYRSDHDIFKDPHDVSLHAMNALWMWSNLFEVIVFESCLIMLSQSTWKILYENYYNLMEALENNYEINIFVMLCMMKFDACLYMYNFGRGIPLSDRIHYSPQSCDYIDRSVSSRFIFVLCAHYHAKFKNNKHNISSLMMHLMERDVNCICQFCIDINNFSNGDIRTVPFDSIFDSKNINNIGYFFTIVSHTFDLIRNFFGKDAISLMETIFIGHIDSFNTDYITDNYDLTGVVMFDVGNIWSYKHTRLELRYLNDNDNFLENPIICVDKFENARHLSIFNENTNVCEIPILSKMASIPNFFAYISAYFNDTFLRMKSHQRIRMWPLNDKNHDEMIVFRYVHGIGIYFKSGFLFDTFFRSFNDAMIFSGKDIEMYDRPMIRLADMTYSLDLSMNNRKDDTKEQVSLSKLQNRCAIAVMNHLIDNFDCMMYGENEYERSFIFSKIINKFTSIDEIWMSMMFPYVCPGTCIIDSSTFDIIRFSNVGFNIISSIKCFFSNASQIEKAIIKYDAVKLIESRLNNVTYTYSFADVVQEKYKTQQSELLSMMPLTKRFLFKSNQYIDEHPDEEYVPLNGFENSTYELCKMIYALCCMDDIFLPKDSIQIFMSLRLNEHVDVPKRKMLYIKSGEYSSDERLMYRSMVTDLFFDIIYSSCFSTKFTVFGGSIAPCTSSNDIVQLKDDEIDEYRVHGTSQCISTVSFMQKSIERNNIYIGCSHKSKKTSEKQSQNMLHRFPMPIYIPKNNNNTFPMLSDHLDRLSHEEPIPLSRFQKKEFLQYSIPDQVLIYLNNIDNCKRLSFVI